MIIKANLVHSGWNQVDDDFVLYVPKDEKYFVLNSTGAELWKFLINGETSFEQIVTYFLNEFDCSKEVVESDLLDLIKELEKNELVEVR